MRHLDYSTQLISLSTGAHLCRKAKFNKNLHLTLHLLKLEWEAWGKKSAFQGLFRIQMGLCCPKPVFIQSGLSVG